MSNIKENKMGVMPINRLLITMSLPMVVSMLVQALYNVVDSVFVSMVSENALTAVSLAFPVQNLMIGVATGTAVGVNALLSRSLGEKNYILVNKIAENGIFLALVGYVVFLLFGLFGAEFFFKIQTGNAEIISEGTRYLRVCTVLSFGVFVQIMFERLMQSTGNTILTMYSQGLGAVINIILDPVFIFGNGKGIFGIGVFGLGTEGAAIATVIGQMVGAVVAIILNHFKNKELKVRVLGFRPDSEIIKRIYAIGVPSMIMIAIGSVMTFSLNKILISFTKTAAAVFGVYFKLQSFIFMPVFGLNNGVIPIVAYNYGARKKDRMMKTIKLATVYAVTIMFAGSFLMQVFPRELLGFFNASDAMLSIGVPALKTISLSFVFAGFCIALGSVFQALGRGSFSMGVSFARQLVVLVPTAYLLSLTGSVNNVWWAFPIAEIASLSVSLFFFYRIYNSTIKKIPSNK